MEYLSLKQWAEKHSVAERTARYYCRQGKIAGARLIGKSWTIPANSIPPKRNKSTWISLLLKTLRDQRESGLKGGIYHRIQIDLTYNSNHIEGSRLTHDQTRYIFETNTIGVCEASVNVDDIIETSNHFRAIDYIIDNAERNLSEEFIKRLHFLVKSGTSDERKDWFRIGEYKLLPNEVGGNDTVEPENVHEEIVKLLDEYNRLTKPRLEDIVDFHKRFEAIHPFQDGNGRVGRLIMFRECLRLGYIPFIITDELKYFYYRGLQHWPETKGFLMDTCLTAQDHFKTLLKKFRIPFDESE